MKDKDFKELIKKFKKEVLDLEVKYNQNYEKSFGKFLIKFDYDIWRSEFSNVTFNEAEYLEVFDLEKDEEVILNNVQLDELNQIANLITSMENEEYEHPSEHAFNLGE